MIPRFIIYTALALILLYQIVSPTTFWYITLVGSIWLAAVGFILVFTHGAAMLRGKDN